MKTKIKNTYYLFNFNERVYFYQLNTKNEIETTSDIKKALSFETIGDTKKFKDILLNNYKEQFTIIPK